ncbi:hypothetical protein [Noviherbaspirillum sp.]|uniref:hypothetical protein n=1 Tax=Noviherbaspirillum sp. TaxID=1926288 RepID=UPI002B4A00C9|nr:hypothetical protein [Noviherbaspirillum sp.]HJV80375.1 hypothetical protein [Noviherbaspirillum sp.]
MHSSPSVIAAFVLVAAFSLGGCATSTQSSIGTAATTPLSDLNIVRSEIPEILQSAQDKPYEMPADHSCPVIALRVHELDAVLGADLDAPGEDDNPNTADRGAETVRKSALGALQRTAEGVVPFRGWVRKLSGAERHSKHVATAIAAGSARRAFLKGVGASQGCALGAPEQAAAATQ